MPAEARIDWRSAGGEYFVYDSKIRTDLPKSANTNLRRLDTQTANVPDPIS
jgi:hypothetical protein